MRKTIAERKLLYSECGSNTRKELIVKLHEPVEVEPGSVNFEVDHGVSSCEIEFVGLKPEFKEIVYGADSLQAVALASDVDPIIRRLGLNFDFFFPNGEPYFE